MPRPARPRSAKAELAEFLQGVEARNPGQPEYVQAVADVMADVLPVIMDDADYRAAALHRRLVEPDRVIAFRITWHCDKGMSRVERGWRVQHSNAIGPYKGGLRFQDGLTESVLKFLAFEQTFKNSLTGLPLGGAKGGATFNPKGKSDAEVMRFCQAFMSELVRHIGPDEDVPAGDIGVGEREIGFLFGQYKRLTGRFDGALTGKGVNFGGSLMRPEATGYGVVLFLKAMLERVDGQLAGKRVAVSGAGNVALHAAEKAVQCGAVVVTLSDSEGVLHDPAGLDAAKLDWIKTQKLDRRGPLSAAADRFKGARFHKGLKPWTVECDVALPCATQNELDEADAKALIGQGVTAVVEGANMPCTAEAVAVLRQAGVAFGPGKAANAGGVAVSGLEMSQNAVRLAWDAPRVTEMLEQTMAAVHARCVEHGEGARGRIDYLRGANVGGFVKVADAMLAYGLV